MDMFNYYAPYLDNAADIAVVGPQKAQVYDCLRYLEFNPAFFSEIDILGTMAVGDWSFYDYYLDQLASIAYEEGQFAMATSGYHGWPGEDANCETSADPEPWFADTALSFVLRAGF